MFNLYTFNPWWQQKEVDAALKGKPREVFDQIYDYIDTRQIILLSGLRRVGKTTLLFLLIDKLLGQDVDPYRILYFSFDEQSSSIEEILKKYEADILKNNLNEIKTYIFLDEIQKLNNWGSKIKILYDMYPRMKIFLSESASINLMKKTRESLAGRFFDFKIEVLDFDQYLKFMDVEIDKDREDIFAVQIKRQFSYYLKTGGFIETFNLDQDKLDKYFKETLLERVVFTDLPVIYRLDRPSLLFTLLKIIANHPGFLLDYRHMASDLKIDQRTLSNYISYLEYGLLVQKAYNFSPNFLTSEKKLKKIYLSNPAFTTSLAPDVNRGWLMEQYFINYLKARFFYRNPQKEEIDVILESDNKPVPVEIKIRNKIKLKALNPMLKFLKKYDLKQGFVISEDTHELFSKNQYQIEIIPYWKYWTLNRKLSLDKKS
ncbi:MAG: ATP-binding protein [Actinomycetia bacterium]|nr:ATP-binding protein [Actinomycetes bacterium]